MEIPPTIDAIHDAYDRGELKPSELVERSLERAKPNRLNAWITFCGERALARAKLQDGELASLKKVPRTARPLFGIPTGLKDNLALEGVAMTCASRMLANEGSTYVAPYTATAVERLEAAGALTLGKTNLDEFAMGGSNEHSAFGPVAHPTDASRVPGGSSGGSAAAVADGDCTIALGSDTGGSVRLPASFCGITGMKPTYGQVSRYGLVAFGSSLDQIGPMARSVRDTRRVYEAIAAFDPRDATSAGTAARKRPAAVTLQGQSFGWPERILKEGLDAPVASALEASAKALEKAGARRVVLDLPTLGHSVAVYYIAALCEASSNLSRFDGVRYGPRSQAATRATQLAGFYEGARELFGAEVKRRILLGTYALSHGYKDAFYLQAARVRRKIQRELLDALTKVSFILMPVAPMQAFKRGAFDQDPLQMYLLDLFTIPANLAGLPALSLPWSGSGLPVGVQLLGRPHDDWSLLGFAEQLEALRGV